MLICQIMRGVTLDVQTIGLDTDERRQVGGVPVALGTGANVQNAKGTGLLNFSPEAS